MGWGYGIVEDKEVGYNVEATCEHFGCTAEIDRGLAYKCGNTVGSGPDYCNGFFCDEHLYYTDGKNEPRCQSCAKIPETECLVLEGEQENLAWSDGVLLFKMSKGCDVYIGLLVSRRADIDIYILTRVTESEYNDFMEEHIETRKCLRSLMKASSELYYWECTNSSGPVVATPIPTNLVSEDYFPKEGFYGTPF